VPSRRCPRMRHVGGALLAACVLLPAAASAASLPVPALPSTTLPATQSLPRLPVLSAPRPAQGSSGSGPQPVPSGLARPPFARAPGQTRRESVGRPLHSGPRRTGHHLRPPGRSPRPDGWGDADRSPQALNRAPPPSGAPGGGHLEAPPVPGGGRPGGVRGRETLACARHRYPPQVGRSPLRHRPAPAPAAARPGLEQADHPAPARSRWRPRGQIPARHQARSRPRGRAEGAG